MHAPNLPTLLAALFGFLASVGGASAEFPEAPLLEQERAQTRIQKSTMRAGAQLDLVIDEFERNGLAGGDLQVLKAIRGVLGSLSDTQMAEIVTMLGEAGAAPGSPEAGSKVFNAFAGQKTVIVQLRRILLEYQTQVALFELARRVRELGDRQTTNLHEAIGLASDNNFDVASPSAMHQVSLQLQNTEQEALRDEVSMVVEKLEKIAGLTEGSPDPRAAQGSAFCKECKLTELVEKAAAELKEKRVMSAVSLEKESRDHLWELATILEPDKSTLEKLVEALDRLDENIAEQAEIAKETEKLGKDDEGNKPKPQFPREAQNKIDNLERSLANVEKSKENRVEQLEASIDRAQKEKERLVAHAEKALEKSKSQGDERATARQEKALEQAKQRGDQKVEQAEKRAAQGIQDADEKVATAQQKLDETVAQETAKLNESELASRDQRAASELAKDEGILTDRTDFLANEVAEIAPDSADALREAISPMQDARAALASNDTPSAIAAEEAALEKLGEAREALVEKIAEESPVMEVPNDHLAELKALLEDVKAIKQGQETLKDEAAKLAQAGDEAGLQEKSADQAGLEAETGEAVASAMEQSLPEAAGALEQAMSAMAASGADLAGGENAPEEQAEAIEKLAEAEQAIGEKIEELSAAAEQLASVEELLEQLAPMIDEQAALAESGSDAAEAQGDLAEQSASLAEQAANTSPQASENLQAAAANQQQAAEQLAAQQSASARQEAALNQMNAAQAALQQQASEFAEQLGREEMMMPDMEALGALAEAIAEAQGHVASAQETLGTAEAAEDFAEAAPNLGEAGEAIEPFTSEPDQALPPGVSDALATADTALGEASAAAEAGEGDPARGNAGLAADSLAQAAAAVALAQAGLGGEMAQMESEGEGQGEQQPGEGNKPGEGKGQQQGDQPSDAPPSDQGTGDQGNYASGSGSDGPRRNERGTSSFIGLPQRDRGTLTQSKADAYPAEYGSMIEQYLKNLSDRAGDE